VLYFDNLSADTAAAYLSDGLAEALIVRLGRVDRLVVASRTAVSGFGGARRRTRGCAAAP